MYVSGGDLPKSQFKSPIIINSLDSESHLKRNSSYSFIISTSEFGGRYQALSKNGLLCGRSISIQIISKLSETKSFLSRKDICSLT